MTISTTGTVHWRWNEADVTQFGTQLNLGPVTGTVTLAYKAATGTFMVSPTIRVSLSNGFHTPSGSLALVPILIDELPKNIRARFVVNHFSVSNNVFSDANVYPYLNWGLVLNCSSGTVETDYNGTFYPIPFFRDNVMSPKPINGGRVGVGSPSWTASRFGMITSSYTVNDWYLKHLSMTGSSLSGTDVEAWMVSVQNIVSPNEVSYVNAINQRSQYWEEIHWSGSTFSGKILNKAFLAFYYNPPADFYVPANGAYVEFDSLQFLRHPSGNGVEFQPVGETW